MRSIRSIAFSFISIVAASAGAQQITSGFGGSFVDLSTSGGTALQNVFDDSTFTINTTVGNAFFPAGAITISNNGCVTGSGNASIGYTNSDIPGAPSNPGNVTPGAGILMPFWDDLYPQPGASNSTIYWQETGNTLYIMWKNDNHFADPSPTGGITFEIQVFGGASGSCTPIIQYLYADTIFGGTYATADNGASATIGYAHGTIATLGNAKQSYDTASVHGGLILTLIEGSGGGFAVTTTSPFGAGSLQLDWTGAFPCIGGIYFLGVTLQQGAYPTGWFYGLDIGFPQLGAQIAQGFPFIGTLSTSGTATIGPFTGLPSGLQFWAVSLGVPTISPIPTSYTAPFTYVIP
jgi:hypothetical protein